MTKGTSMKILQSQNQNFPFPVSITFSNRPYMYAYMPQNGALCSIQNILFIICDSLSLPHCCILTIQQGWCITNYIDS